MGQCHGSSHETWPPLQLCDQLDCTRGAVVIGPIPARQGWVLGGLGEQEGRSGTPFVCACVHTHTCHCIVVRCICKQSVYSR